MSEERQKELLDAPRAPLGFPGAALHTFPGDGLHEEMSELHRLGKAGHSREWPDGRIAWRTREAV